MARVSISLPDELMAKLEPIKGKINISQACREALERRIAIFERTAAQPDYDLDLQGLITRLREERVLAEGNWENLGRGNAAAWLSTASYMEIKNTLEHHTSSNGHKYKLPRVAFKTMKQHMKEAQGSLEGPEATVYKTAWLDYTRSVWAQVEDPVHDEGEEARVVEAVEQSER